MAISRLILIVFVVQTGAFAHAEPTNPTELTSALSVEKSSVKRKRILEGYLMFKGILPVNDRKEASISGARMSVDEAQATEDILRGLNTRGSSSLQETVKNGLSKLRTKYPELQSI